MTLYLVDKSAFEQQRHSVAAEEALRALVTENRLATCEIVALELLYSARGVADYERRWVDLQALPWLHVTQARPGPATANSDDQVRFAHAATRRHPGPRESGWDVFRHVPAYVPVATTQPPWLIGRRWRR